MPVTELHDFIVSAKSACYVGDGATAAPSRTGSHDLVFAAGAFRYRDSYFGGTDFLGQEVVWHEDVPVWAMNYYGYVLRPDLIDAQRAGATIKAALSALYAESRFLGTFDWSGPHGNYADRNDGDATHFRGVETISCGGEIAYRFDYHGGLIKP